MSAPKFDNVKKRASFGSFLHRQLFEKPTLPANVDLKGKTAIVTGSNTGIGFECARQLLGMGLSKLILAVRNEDKGKQARDKLVEETRPSSVTGDDTIEVWKLDMEDYASVTAFAGRVQTLERLDIAVLNAGLAKTSYKTSAATGHEETIQVNVLSTALLTILLLPILEAKSQGSPGRIVVVQSDTSSWAKFKERDAHVPLLRAFDDEKNFDRADRYFTSKLVAQLFVTELVKRVPASSSVITMPNPGWTYGTGLGKGGGTVAERIIAVPNRILGRSPAAGARIVTTAAVSFGPEAHGRYIEDEKLQPKAPFGYTPEGENVGSIVWDEIISELSFTGVIEILNGLRGRSEQADRE
ncbi:NAD(P)-binding protein [Apiospora arundinis]